jgi:hypothetical protein
MVESERGVGQLVMYITKIEGQQLSRKKYPYLYCRLEAISVTSFRAQLGAEPYLITYDLFQLGTTPRNENS